MKKAIISLLTAGTLISAFSNDDFNKLNNKSFDIGWHFWTTDDGTGYLASKKYGKNNKISVWEFTQERKWKPVHNADSFDGYEEAEEIFDNVELNNNSTNISFGLSSSEKPNSNTTTTEISKDYSNKKILDYNLVNYSGWYLYYPVQDYKTKTKRNNECISYKYKDLYITPDYEIKFNKDGTGEIYILISYCSLYDLAISGGLSTPNINEYKKDIQWELDGTQLKITGGMNFNFKVNEYLDDKYTSEIILTHTGENSTMNFVIVQK